MSGPRLQQGGDMVIMSSQLLSEKLLLLRQRAADNEIFKVC
jgi:hypothetical protein